MSVCGIITEYNPLHNGHIHHLKLCRQAASSVICIMSGSFTQRGEPAVADKWQRAAWAVAAGADLVIELPLIYAVGSAEIFAEGAVQTLGALGCVDQLCFGSETADNNFFAAVAACQESAAYTEKLRSLMQDGLAYHKATARAVSELLKLPESTLSTPNNILGIEYAKAVSRAKLPITLRPILRQGNAYHDTALNTALASASAIRQALASGDRASISAAVPDYVSQYLRQADLPDSRIFSALLLSSLKLSKAEQLRSLDNISEGLENKLLNASAAAASADELLAKAKSARYPRSRLSRILLHNLLHITADLLTATRQAGPQYARVLAFNEQGRKLLRTLKQTAKIPLILKTAAYLTTKTRQNTSQSLLEQLLTLDTLATDLHCLLCHKSGGLDFTTSPLYINKK